MRQNHLIMTLFGATGDLASRKLYPALYQLYAKNLLSNEFALIGTGRRDWSQDHFRDVVRQSIQPCDPSEKLLEEFLTHFYYLQADVESVQDYAALKSLISQLEATYHSQGNRVFYISLAPTLFATITHHLKEQALLSESGYNRLIIEKPFGYDQESARKLQHQLERSFEEEQIYRIDHYLGKSIVNQILPIRFHNPILKALWQREMIDHIQISLNESLGVEGRGAYYETSGVSRDMIQNHALQLVTLLTLAEPDNLSAQAIRQAKIQILKNLRLTNGSQDLVRGQYGPSINGKEKGYLQEDGVAPDSQVETFMAVKVFIDLPEWQNVPIYLRSGKALKDKKTDIKIVFKSPDPDLPANYLQFELAPDPKIRLRLNQMDSTQRREYKDLPLSYQVDSRLAKRIPKDYEKLLYDCFQGDLNNFAHFLEVDYAWQFIDQIHQLWQQEATPLYPYPAQSQGPQAADDLLRRDNRQWIQE